MDGIRQLPPLLPRRRLLFLPSPSRVFPDTAIEALLGLLEGIETGRQGAVLPLRGSPEE